ncbi:hypothetical protein WMY93_008589 [Mugilogobius chulae]|uniref:C2H2-type domain-containing protein n=1 Tax=Mugilogobius chulae TaxID=88201 RepID=A0AAW0PVM2_9GOBI
MHCTASFSRPSQLLQHQRTEHADKPSGFLCTECGRTFNSHSNLRIHLNVHTGARPYSCCDCGKSFSQSEGSRIWQGFGPTRELTQAKNRTGVIIAANALRSLELSKFTLVSTQESGPLPAKYVKKASLTDLGYAFTIELSMV